MAKGKNDPINGNDYIDQLQPQAQHRRRASICFEPKWKYKIVYRFPEMSPFDRVVQFAMLGTVLFVLAKTAIANINTENRTGVIIGSGIITLLITILFFAIRDGSKDDHSKHID